MYKVRSLFFSDAGGQECAAETNGVRVLCGLGRGSGTGDLLRGAVSFLARATQTSLQKSLGGRTVFGIFSVFLVNVVLRHVSARLAARRLHGSKLASCPMCACC